MDDAGVRGTSSHSDPQGGRGLSPALSGVPTLNKNTAAAQAPSGFLFCPVPAQTIGYRLLGGGFILFVKVTTLFFFNF